MCRPETINHEDDETHGRDQRKPIAVYGRYKPAHQTHAKAAVINAKTKGSPPKAKTPKQTPRRVQDDGNGAVAVRTIVTPPSQVLQQLDAFLSATQPDMMLNMRENSTAPERRI